MHQKGMKFSILSNVGTLKRNGRWMAKHGLASVYLGIESLAPQSGERDALVSLGRGWQSQSETGRQISYLASQAVFTYGLYILGNPGVSPEAEALGVELLATLPVPLSQGSTHMPFTGTADYRKAVREGRIHSWDPDDVIYGRKVWDTGDGISPEDLEGVFIDFHDRINNLWRPGGFVDWQVIKVIRSLQKLIVTMLENSRLYSTAQVGVLREAHAVLVSTQALDFYYDEELATRISLILLKLASYFDRGTLKKASGRVAQAVGVMEAKATKVKKEAPQTIPSSEIYRHSSWLEMVTSDQGIWDSLSDDEILRALEMKGLYDIVGEFDLEGKTFSPQLRAALYTCITTFDTAELEALYSSVRSTLTAIPAAEPTAGDLQMPVVPLAATMTTFAAS